MAGLDSRGLQLGAGSDEIAVRTMAAARVAAAAAFEVIRGGEHEVWPFVVKILRGKFLRDGSFFRLSGIDLGLWSYVGRKKWRHWELRTTLVRTGRIWLVSQLAGAEGTYAFSWWEFGELAPPSMSSLRGSQRLRWPECRCGSVLLYPGLKGCARRE